MTVTVDAVCYFKINDAIASVVKVEDSQNSTRLLIATTLRNILGTKSLQEILRDKDLITKEILVKFCYLLFNILNNF